MRQFIGLGLVAVGLVACAPQPTAISLPDGTDGFGGTTGPQYEPGDPCKGVVPELCAY